LTAKELLKLKVMSIRKGMLIAVGMLCSLQMFAQNKYNSDYPKMEIGLQLGVTEFLGDLGGGNGDGKAFIGDTDWRYTKPLLGIYYKHHFKSWIAISANLNLTKVQGSDAAAGNPNREARGLEFKSNIFELYGLAHVTPLRFGKVGLHGSIGLGFFAFNPKTNSDNPNTQSADYSKIQAMIPMGAGMTYQLNNNWVLGADVMHRVTFTDYIDNYSHDNPKRNDSYYSILFKVGYILDNNVGFGKGIGCPGQL
jgi:hypothetical protein